MSITATILTVGGVHLHVEEHGRGAPILCIHGTGSSAAAWRSAIDRLAPLGRVIAYDRRGCSRSERPEPYEQTSVERHADDAAAILDALEATPAVVIGRSYGGEVALALALRHPERVRALVILEGAPMALVPAALAWEQALTRRVEAVAAQAGAEAAGEALVREVVGDPGWEHMPDALRRTITANGPAILAELRGGGLDVDATALARIDRPVLVVTAEESPAVFREAGAAMARAVPGARPGRVGGGHLIDPADPAVLEFVEEVLR